jgi:hypothetical protein
MRAHSPNADAQSITPADHTRQPWTAGRWQPIRSSDGGISLITVVRGSSGPADERLAGPPDVDAAADSSCPLLTVLDGLGGHRYFELSKPLLSLSSPTAPGPRRPDESHATSAGSRNESDEPGT